jgi:hypothetical protein
VTTFQTVANEFLKAFTKDNPRQVWSLVDGAPDWMRDAIRDAHFDGRLPDDWIYEHARLIVSELSEREAPDSDDTHEICDSLVDIYTNALTAWLASHTGNLALCDEAVSEGLTSGEESTERRIQSAQYMALTYIAGALLSAIEAQAEERASGDGADGTEASL